jgi:hypothetical protein
LLNLKKRLPCTQASAFVNKAVKFVSQANVLPESLSHDEINDNLGLPSEYTEKVEAFVRKLGLPL